jgi:hypothetical protein
MSMCDKWHDLIRFGYVVMNLSFMMMKLWSVGLLFLIWTRALKKWEMENGMRMATEEGYRVQGAFFSFLKNALVQAGITNSD